MFILSDQSKLFNYAWRLFRCVLVAYLVVLLAMMLFENYLIYFPKKFSEADTNWSPVSPSPIDVEFQSADGTNLHGWFLSHPKSQAVVLYAHGNAGNIADRIQIMRKIYDQEVSIMFFDYRGYGKSEGRPNENGLKADARAARAWLAKKTGIKEEEIVLMGRSLGGGVMVELAAKDGAAGLILESTFTSLPDVAQKIYPWLPVKLLMRNRFDSESVITQYQGPLLQSHSKTDEIIAYDFGKKLFEKATTKDKQFIEITGGHNESPAESYYKKLKTFLKKNGVPPK